MTVSRLEQRAGRMTREQAAAALRRHHREPHGDGAGQVVEDDAAAARVAAIDRGWSVDELLRESGPAAT